MSISLEEFAGHGDVPEGTLRALVTRTTEPARLKELARNFGIPEGPALGISVHINHLTGAVTGSNLQFVGGEQDVIIACKIPARQLWEEADRQLYVTITVRVRMRIFIYDILKTHGSTYPICGRDDFFENILWHDDYSYDFARNKLIS